VTGCQLLAATSSGILNREPRQQEGSTYDQSAALQAQRLSRVQVGGSVPCGGIGRAAAAAAQRHGVAGEMHGGALSSTMAGAEAALRTRSSIWPVWR
jgi:hypothetical protein